MTNANTSLKEFNRKNSNLLKSFSPQMRSVVENAFRAGWKAGIMTEEASQHVEEPEQDFERIPDNADPLMTSVNRWRR